MKQNKLIVIAVVFLLAGFGLAAMLYQSSQTEQKTELVQQNQAALSKMHSPRAGNPAAKVTIVEFLDPACETCRDFYPLVKQLMAAHPDQVNLVIRYAPLHPGSDQMVKILDAARVQGKFWDVLDLMFETQPAWASHHNPQPEVFWGYLQNYGFDVAKLREYVNSPAADAVLAQEIADGQALGATKTPTFFVNGKPLPSFGYEQLQALVAQEIAANYP